MPLAVPVKVAFPGTVEFSVIGVEQCTVSPPKVFTPPAETNRVLREYRLNLEAVARRGSRECWTSFRCEVLVALNFSISSVGG